MSAGITVLLGSFAGLLAALVAALLPGVHIFNIMGLAAWLLWSFGTTGGNWPLALICSMVAGFSVTSIVPVVYAAVSDEGLYFSVSPANEYVLEGREKHAVALLAFGAVPALLSLVLAAPLLPRLLCRIIAVIRPHQQWIVWSIIVYLLLSEWPREQLGPDPLRRFMRAMTAPAVGLLVFLLSGILGILVMHTPLLSGARVPSQALMPACIGLFTVPWLLMNILGVSDSVSLEKRAGTSPPAPVEKIRRLPFSGMLSGLGGGLFAAILPGVTAGVGGYLSGQAASNSHRDDFLVSQGASRAAYFGGCLLLTILPGGIPRGGAGWLIQSWVPSLTPADYYRGVAAIALGAGGAVLLLSPLCRWYEFVRRNNFNKLAAAVAFILLTGNVIWFTGLYGLLVMLAGGAIGALPPLFGARRMNTLGVILLPVALALSGQGGLAGRLLRLY